MTGLSPATAMRDLLIERVVPLFFNMKDPDQSCVAFALIHSLKRELDSLVPEVPGVESGVSAGLSPADETIVTKVPEEVFITEAVDRKSLLQMFANVRPAQRLRTRVEVHPDAWSRMLADPQLTEILVVDNQGRTAIWVSLFGWPVEIKDEPGLTLRLVVDAQP